MDESPPPIQPLYGSFRKANKGNELPPCRKVSHGRFGRAGKGDGNDVAPTSPNSIPVLQPNSEDHIDAAKEEQKTPNSSEREWCARLTEYVNKTENKIEPRAFTRFICIGTLTKVKATTVATVTS